MKTNHPLDMTLADEKERIYNNDGRTYYDDKTFYVDVGYGNIEIVNTKVCNYICRLRQIIKEAGLTPSPRRNYEDAVARAKGTAGDGI